MPGLELARRFYAEAVRPLLGDLPHAAARVGQGSDVLGYDTLRSADHDWGPRLELFLRPEDLHRAGELSAMLSRRLPKRFLGWPTHFEPPGARVRSMAETDGPVDHYVRITDPATWCRDVLGFDPAGGVTLLDWVATPWQRFAEVTGGAVFHDGPGELSAARRAVAWYPDDVWRFALAGLWRRIGEEESFVGRAAQVGDDLGSRVLAARLAREVGRLVLLLGRVWPPYEKWLGSALRGKPAADHLERALRAADGETRQDALCAAYEAAGRMQNELGLAAFVDATRRPFHDRPFPVIDAGRFADALTAAITDPAVAALSPTGTVDRFLDGVIALGSNEVRRATMAAAHHLPITNLG
jgi:hypothetical protein